MIQVLFILQKLGACQFFFLGSSREDFSFNRTEHNVVSDQIVILELLGTLIKPDKLFGSILCFAARLLQHCLAVKLHEYVVDKEM